LVDSVRYDLLSFPLSLRHFTGRGESSFLGKHSQNDIFCHPYLYPGLSQLSRSETALYKFSSAAQRALIAQLDQAAAPEQEAVEFFKGESRMMSSFDGKDASSPINPGLTEQGKLFTASLEDGKTLPWVLIQIASMSLEAFSLLELGIEQRLDEMAANKIPDQVRPLRSLFSYLCS